jgi:hypothetical protein
MTIKRALVLAMAAMAAMAGTAVTSCSSGQGADGSQRTVFPTTSPTLAGVTDKITVPTGQIVNFGVANLYNTSNARVTIRAIKLIAPSGPAIRDITYRAYAARDAVAPLGLQGDLPKTCSQEYKPSPMSSLSVAARSSMLPEAVVSFTITKPGHYTMGTMRIDYVSGGRRYWQLYYLPLKITAVPAASNQYLIQSYRCRKGHPGKPK